MTETLEEAAERIYPNEGYKDEAYCDLGEMSRELWLEGTKWQQERSYSEEDLKLLLKKFKKDIINSTELDDDFETLVCDIETNKWFEQFKKK